MCTGRPDPSLCSASPTASSSSPAPWRPRAQPSTAAIYSSKARPPGPPAAWAWWPIRSCGAWAPSATRARLCWSRTRPIGGG